VARLYQDENHDDEITRGRGTKSKLREYQDEMKVFDMEGSDEDEGEVKRKRESKTPSGVEGGKPRKQRTSEGSGLKVNRLKFTPGSLGLFAISEVHSTYLIVNFTRNTKGFIALPEKEDLN
jgi:hypothetical protein